MSWNVLNNGAALATVIHCRNFSFQCWTGGLWNGHLHVRNLEERESQPAGVWLRTWLTLFSKEALCEKVFLAWLPFLDEDCPSLYATLISLSTVATLSACSHLFFALAIATSFFLALSAATWDEVLWEFGRLMTPGLFVVQVIWDGGWIFKVLEAHNGETGRVVRGSAWDRTNRTGIYHSGALTLSTSQKSTNIASLSTSCTLVLRAEFPYEEIGLVLPVNCQSHPCGTNTQQVQQTHSFFSHKSFPSPNGHPLQGPSLACPPCPSA